MKKSLPDILIIFLLTAATIIFEISLSRLFSYLLSFHFVLIIIAFSILGLGIGQISYAKFYNRMDKALGFWAALPAIAMFLGFSLLLALSKISGSSFNDLGLLAFIVFSIVPFIAIGVVYTFIFERNKRHASTFYAIDLIGAAGGALVSVYLLNTFSLVFVVAIAIALLLVVWAIHAFASKNRYSMALSLLSVAIIILMGLGKDALDIDIPISKDPSKDMYRLMNNPALQSEKLESRWSAFGKTDLVQFTYPDSTVSKTMFIDGAAGTEVVNIDELAKDNIKIRKALSGFPAVFAMNFVNENDKDSVLIIGPGGGIDIAAAYFSGYSYVDAVEVNPSFVQLMEKYNPATFLEKENIKVEVNEGRNFVIKNKGKYDAILLTIPVTKGSRGTDFYGLTENYLFTMEALADYLEGLTENGAIYFTMHGRQEVYKMLANYMELQDRMGIGQKEALKKVYIFSNGMNPVLVIKKTPFEQEIIEEVHRIAHYLELDQDAFYFPYIKQEGLDTIVRNVNYQWFMFDDLIYDISSGTYPHDELWKTASINLRPVSDDSPYFFNYNNGIPDAMATPLWLGIFIIGWFLFNHVNKWKSVSFYEDTAVTAQKKFRVLALLVFLLGFSYILIQGYLFQVLNLKLSSPSQSFSLLLFTFLLGNGMGSLMTRAFKKNLPQKLTVYAALIIIACLVTVYVLLPMWYERLSEFWVAILLLFPSFFVGVPFPLLLRIATSFKEKQIISYLLGISSVAGVAASIFAIVISILYGYSYVFLLGLLGYAVLIVMAYRLKKTEIVQL
ncbi:hypothetical protein MTsPCn9_22400 [Croceitalea sp. MTPC9]|uniref:Major facilitator superfamily (MFS) profile domain-containing protein n=1 Tax=Croceitalea marina TaxID=1775166 RepID=A0ABW5MU86_9FLAO|nr:hypothetical protein MTsPCn6_23860 [Croceitalea sp. MTPC6]GMN17304.1 hypothetical protein MTsPCn9_22400 [Croceitalea sp. MTPC9]